MGCDNSNLHRAKAVQDDEFYTMLEDIEKELEHYKGNFINKTIYCNCDDYQVSNFFKFFGENFERFHLKKLIATCYKGGTGRAVKAIMTDPSKVSVNELTGDGSFDSPECLELLKEADIVVTNPPFSIIRNLFDILIKNDKKFILIGPTTAIYHKVLLPKFQSGELQIGINYVKNFINHGQLKLVGAVWYTTVPNDIPKRKLILEKEYTPYRYPKYDNYDAIECNDSNKIPKFYYGVIGVPLSYSKFHNPDEFEILGISDSLQLNGKEVFARIFIRRKTVDEPEPSLW